MGGMGIDVYSFTVCFEMKRKLAGAVWNILEQEPRKLHRLYTICKRIYTTLCY